MPTELTLNDLEHMGRMLREATEMDAIDRAVANYAAHDLATRIEQRHITIIAADCEDVDHLTAELDAVRVQLGTVRSQLADIQAANADDASVLQRYQAGYHAGTMDDPAPLGSPDEWYMRGFKAGNAVCVEADLRIERDELRQRVADLASALEAARSANPPIGYLAISAQGANNHVVTGVTTVKFPETLTVPTTPRASQVLDATPTELAAAASIAHRGEQAPQRTKRAARPETGFRYKGTNEKLLEETIAAIRAMAAELGRSPTSTDWSERCSGLGLPTLETLRTRLEKTWLQLVLAADLAPAPSDGRRSYRDVPVGGNAREAEE